MHSFAGNHAGSQALCIEFSLLLLFQSFFAGEAKTQQRYGCSSKQKAFDNKLVLINAEIIHVCKVKLAKVETKKENVGLQNTPERDV